MQQNLFDGTPFNRGRYLLCKRFWIYLDKENVCLTHSKMVLENCLM